MTAPLSQASAESSIWRTKGDPLVAPDQLAGGPLQGETVAVKDLFAVAGHRIGAGNPAWLEQSAPEERSAPAVAALLSAGAELTGISHTDEFAYSLAGTNAHYGTPVNPAAPGRIPGGSSSGSASAVAAGEVSIGLGTDTGGSIRVPSAYQGLWGIRTTHGLVPTDGLMPLAQSFDTVGWMTRTPELLSAVAEVLIPAEHEQRELPSDAALKFPQDLLKLADDDVALALERLVTSAERDGTVVKTVVERQETITTETLQGWLEQGFQPLQAAEAWANHGTWISQHWNTMAPDTGARFRAASKVTGRQAERAREIVVGAREIIRSWVGSGVLAVPSAASAAPTLEAATAGSPAVNETRRRNLMLTCLAGLSGLPVVNVPTRTVPTRTVPPRTVPPRTVPPRTASARTSAGLSAGLPSGLSLIGPAGADRALIRWAAQRWGVRTLERESTT